MAGVVMNMNQLDWNFHVDMVLLTLKELWLHGGVASEMHRRYVEPLPVEEDPKNKETWALDHPAEVSSSAALQCCVPHLGKKLYHQGTWCAPPTQDGAKMNWDLTGTPHPMAPLVFETPNRVSAPFLGGSIRT